jgi:hypothetical protein
MSLIHSLVYLHCRPWGRLNLHVRHWQRRLDSSEGRAKGSSLLALCHDGQCKPVPVLRSIVWTIQGSRTICQEPNYIWMTKKYTFNAAMSYFISCYKLHKGLSKRVRICLWFGVRFCARFAFKPIRDKILHLTPITMVSKQKKKFFTCFPTLAPQIVHEWEHGPHMQGA